MRNLLDKRTGWQREAIGKQQQAHQPGHEELVMSVLELVVAVSEQEREGAVFNGGAVDEPHHQYEADCAENTNGREILDRVHALVLQNGKRRRV